MFTGIWIYEQILLVGAIVWKLSDMHWKEYCRMRVSHVKWDY